MKLTRRQKQLAEGKLTGPSVIKGEKGTGKRQIGIARLVYLNEQKETQRILWVTPNEEQMAVTKRRYEGANVMRNWSLFEYENKEQVRICSVKVLMSQNKMLAEFVGKSTLIEEVPDPILSKALQMVRKHYPKVKVLGNKYKGFLLQELNWMKDCYLVQKEAYLFADRQGCEIKLKKEGKSREAIWLLHEVIEKLLAEEKLILYKTAYIRLLEEVKVTKKLSCYQHMIIENTQDFTKLELEWVKALLIEEKESSLLFLMDQGPSQVKNSWLKKAKGRAFTSIGYDMTGKVVTLKRKKEKRTSHQVKASELTPLEVFLMDLEQEKMQNEPMVNKLPWHVEQYKYINKLTGVETIFQRDTSIGEVYIDGEVISEDETQEIPMYSDIAAGMPIEIIDGVSEGFTLPGALLNYKKQTYLLHVQGDSMIGADIQDGDYVVIQAGNVMEHEIAAVYYNGGTTLKRIVKKDEQILLMSENPKYAPIIIEDGDFRVMGRLIGIIKTI